MSIEHNERQFGAGMGSKKSHVPVLTMRKTPLTYAALCDSLSGISGVELRLPPFSAMLCLGNFETASLYLLIFVTHVFVRL